MAEFLTPKPIAKTLYAQKIRFSFYTPLAVRRSLRQNRKSMRFNIQRLSAHDVVADYHQKLDERINKINENDNLSSLWDSIHGAVSTAAREVICAAQRRPRNGWFDEEYQRVTDEKNVARSRMLVSGTRQRRERNKDARAAEKRIHRRKKKEHEEAIIAQA